MSDAGVSLTIIGVIATLIAMMFAAAAAYVSHKRRMHQHAAYHVPGTAAHPHLASHPHAPAPLPAVPQAAEKPLFKKLSPGGLVDPAPVDKQQPHVYLWD